MRSLARISAIGIVGLGLGTATTALGLKDATPTAAGPANAGSVQTTSSSAATGPSNEPTNLSTVASTGADAGRGGMASNADERKPGGGGYSWSEKQRRAAHKASKSAPLDPRRPIAQSPNFELRPDGSSVVTLLLSRPTEVTRVIVGRRVEYQLKDAQIGVANNMNPLVTAHFASPVARVVLRRNKLSATLRLELREKVQPTHLLRDGPAGSSMLEITLPKPTHGYVAPPSQPQSMQGDKDAQSDLSTRRERRKTKRSTQKSGPGPRL